MAGSPIYPQVGYPLSDAELRKRMGKGNPLYEFLQMFASRDKVYQAWDFLEDTFNGDFWALANSSGTSAADFAIAVAEDGVITGDTGTDDNASISMISPLVYTGDRNAGCHVRIKIDDPTEYCLEVGFIDAVPGSNGPGIADVDTPTAAATDCALLHIDTDETIQTLAFVTAGNGFTTTATTLPAPITNLTAATYVDVRIQLVGNSAFLWVNGHLAASHTGDRVEGGTTLALWVFCATRESGVARFPTIDLIEVWKDRNV